MARLTTAEAPARPTARPPVDPADRPPERHRSLRPLLLALLTLALLAGAGWLLRDGGQATAPAGPLTASGTLEADEVRVGPEVSGRLLSLAREGDQVRTGEVVARLDDSLLQLQFRQADPASQQQLANLLERYQLRAPLSGVVTRVPAHPGEVVTPGQTVVALADLSQLDLTAYVLERDLGRVRVGQRVEVTADPFAGRTFEGVVTSTNPRAEFTPRNVQTQADRLNLVFGVKIRVANPDGALKPGMPADARFQPLP